MPIPSGGQTRTPINLGPLDLTGLRDRNAALLEALRRWCALWSHLKRADDAEPVLRRVLEALDALIHEFNRLKIPLEGLYQGDLQGTLDRRAAVEKALSVAANLDLLRKQFPNLHLGFNMLADPCWQCAKAADLLAQVVPAAVTSAGAQTVGAATGEGSPRASPWEFRQDGSVWYVRFGDEGPRQVKDCEGMAYLARLFAQPEKWISPLDLEGRPPAGTASLHRGRCGRRCANVEPVEMRDGFTRDEFSGAKKLERNDVEFLKGELEERKTWHEEAEQLGQGEKARELAEEIKALQEALDQQTRKGRGRSLAAGPAEKARQRVLQAIKTARERLARVKMPRLAEHIKQHIASRGGQCAIRYAPPAQAHPWDVTIL